MPRVLLVLLLLAELLLASDAQASPRRPNVVVVVIDTLRADHVSFMGYPRDTTPFLGSLAARGVVFEKAWSTSGWTVPATASLFTSVYPQQHGMVENLGRRRLRASGAQQKEVQALPDALEPLPVALKKAGYATFGVSDNYHIAAMRGFDRGFDRFFGDNNLGADAVNAKLLSWKSEILGRGPYFVYLHYMDPHHPYRSRDPWFGTYAKDGKVPEWRGHNKKAAYDSEIRYVDEHLKELHEALGWERDTVLIVTSDHGEEFGEHGAGGHASSLYRELLHVPFLVYGGGFAPRRVPEPVGLVDVLPTVREVAGLPRDPAAEGVSLQPVLLGGAADGRRTFFAHIKTFGRGHEKERELEGILRTRFKHVREVGGAAELYDMENDPWEKKNLAAIDERTAADLAATYRRFEQVARRYTGTTRTFVLDKETEEKLKALGYIQ
jgi:choline-sulfatase